MRPLPSPSPDRHHPGKAFREGDACLAHLLLDVCVNQCAEDIQDRTGEGVRPEMCYPRNRRRRRAGIDVRRRIAVGEDDES